MKKNKILILVPDLKKPGGVANYYNVIKPYLKTDIDFFIRGTKSNSLSKFLDFILDYFKFLFTLLRKNYSLIVINNSIGGKSFFRDYFFISFLNLLKKKYVIFFRGWEDKSANEVFKNKRYKNSILKSVMLIVLAKEFKDYLMNNGYSNSIVIETTIIDDSLIEKKSKFKKEKNIKELNLLFLSRVEKTKGIFEIIQAYEILKVKYPFLKLTIAGDGSQLTVVKSLVQQKELSNVIFTGYVKDDEKAEVLTKADIFLFPSYHEGMPNSVLEAMGFGLPIITRPVGGLFDFFENGNMGFMTESKSSKVLAGLIEKLVLDKKLRDEISANNKEFAKENFFANKVAKRITDIYNQVLRGEIKAGSWLDYHEDN